jgi:hypothetical protein
LGAFVTGTDNKELFASEHKDARLASLWVD